MKNFWHFALKASMPLVTLNLIISLLKNTMSLC